MIRSGFRFRAFLPLILVILVTGLLCFLFSRIFVTGHQPSPVGYFFICISLFTWTWLVFGELRTKAISVTLDNGSITTTNFFGLGVKRQFGFKDFDGFKTCLLPSNAGTYEYLYLVKRNRKVVKLSEFYHRNYDEFKYVFQQKLKFFGREPFNIVTEVSEIFQ